MTEDWETGLAATKLRPPTPPEQVVARVRLYETLDRAVEGQVPLILASAPAGSGKSTLLAAWLQTRDEDVAWLQVEQNDSDPARFWAYLIEALGQVHSQMAKTLRPLAATSKGDDHVVVPALINQLLELQVRLILVVDDYHLLENSAVHRGMERLVELCPDNVTIVLSTRIDPPLRLGRLRVRQQLVEIRGSDLRFAQDEVAGLLGDASGLLGPASIDLLVDRTEGWAAGLVLAGFSLQRASDPEAFVEEFHGDDQLVVEYLSDELLGGVSERDRHRLLESSILDQMNGPLLDAVTDSTGGANWLTELAANNQMVIGLDRTGTWFRYHHLLRDVFRLELQRTMPERVAELHASAAEWFAEQGDLDRAIHHQLAAGELVAAAQTLYEHGQQLLSDGQTDTLRSILDQLGKVANNRAWCTLMYAWCEYLAGRYERSEKWIERTFEVGSDAFDPTIVVSLQMNLDLARGNVGAALAVARTLTVEQMLSPRNPLATVTGGAFTWAGLGEEARPALKLGSEVVDIPTSQALSAVYGAISAFDAESPGVAHEAADQALGIAESYDLGAYHLMAPAYAIRGNSSDDPVAARLDASIALELTERSSTNLALGYVLAICGDTLLELGDSQGVGLLQRARPVVDRCIDPGIVGRYLDRVESRHGVAEPSNSKTASVANGQGGTYLVEALTDRELAVLRHLPTALTQREIAAELYVSLNTVKTHCGAIYRKLDVKGRKAAVLSAREQGIL